jgi:dihydropyrimidinase
MSNIRNFSIKNTNNIEKSNYYDFFNADITYTFSTFIHKLTGMEPLIIRNGTIVYADKRQKADVWIQDGIIKLVKENIAATTGKYSEIDASGMFVLPGGIDPHVHLQLPTPAGPSSDDFYSGTLAALMGGTTTIIDFVTPTRNQKLADALSERKNEASKSLIDYTFHMGITSWNNNTAEEMKCCCTNEGITSFKAYLAYRDTIGIDYMQLSKVFEKAHELKSIVCVHCEEGETIRNNQIKFISEGKTAPIYHALSRPPETESESVRQVIERAEQINCQVYLVHISSELSLNYIKQAKKKGLKLFAETCPQYLLLNDDLYKKPLPESLKYIMSPPLRQKQNNVSLWKAMTDKNIDVISTDHCPFFLHGQKDIGSDDFTKVPNGSGGIETRMVLLFSYGVVKEVISLERFVELTSESPAKIFGLWPRKGTISAGSDADIVIWNPDLKNIISSEKLHQHCDHTIFEGMQTQGGPAYVIKGGKIAIKDGLLLNDNMKGNFLFRNAD